MIKTITLFTALVFTVSALSDVNQDSISATSDPVAFNVSTCVKASYHYFDFSKTKWKRASSWRFAMFEELGEGRYAPNGVFVEHNYNAYVATKGKKAAAEYVWSSFNCSRHIGSIENVKPAKIAKPAPSPIVKIEPKYPPLAARNRIEGRVRLRFNINEVGGVEDIRVLGGENLEVFSAQAKRALRKWKYRVPLNPDGDGYKDQEVTLTFSLQK